MGGPGFGIDCALGPSTTLDPILAHYTRLGRVKACFSPHLIARKRGLIRREALYGAESGHAKCTDLRECVGVGGRGFGIDCALGPSTTLATLAAPVALLRTRTGQPHVCSYCS